jgi:hypothetical protein
MAALSGVRETSMAKKQCDEHRLQLGTLWHYYSQQRYNA